MNEEYSILLKYSKIPKLSVDALCFLTALQPKLSQNQTLVAALVALTWRSGYSGWSDESVIVVQHYLARIFNDRTPNQRASMVVGWSLVKQHFPELVTPENQKLFCQMMLAGNKAAFPMLFKNLQLKKENSIPPMVGWLI